MLVLENNNARLAVDLQQGGRISSLNINGLEVLVEPAGNPLAWGCYPMAPWVGRLRNGIFNFENRQYDFPLNLDGHALHGTCLNREWKLVRQAGNTLHLAIDLGKHWPCKGEARQTIRLDSDCLFMTLEVHSHAQRFPASLGWHPWFKKQLSKGKPAQLQFSAQAKYACDTQQIPDGSLIEPGDSPWDDCFIGVKNPPRILWPEALELSIHSPASHWVVYNQPEHALCIEPQTAAANAINQEFKTDFPTVDFVSPDKPLRLYCEWQWKILS